MSKPKVYVTVTVDPWARHEAIEAAYTVAGDQRIEGVMDTICDRPYEHAMSRLAERFRAGGFDYWFNLDADQAQVGDVLAVVEDGLDLDIVGFPCPIWVGMEGASRPFTWGVFDRVGETAYRQHETTGAIGGIEEVDAVASGCMMIARRVIEALPRPFERLYDETGLLRLGPDLNFCRMAKEKGFKVWADYRCPCRHWKEIDLYELAHHYARFSATLKEQRQTG